MRVFLNFIALCSLSPLLGGCIGENDSPQTIRETEIFGTRIVVIVAGESEDKAANAISEVFSHFAEMHRRFHPWREGELAEINRAIAEDALPLTVSAPMAKMISLSADYSRRSGGLFNPAAGELFALWGFHSDDSERRPPSASEIAAHLSDAPQMKNVELRGRILQNVPQRARFDFGAIAKGAALDAARDILRRRDIAGALINAGGDILVIGDNNGRPWRIALHPANVQMELADGEAASTSGGNARFFDHNGRRYHHLINPRNGAPSESAKAAATAASQDSRHAGAISDAAATALALASEEEGREIARAFGLSAALQTDGEGAVHFLIAKKRFRQTKE